MKIGDNSRRREKAGKGRGVSLERRLGSEAGPCCALAPILQSPLRTPQPRSARFDGGVQRNTRTESAGLALRRPRPHPQHYCGPGFSNENRTYVASKYRLDGKMLGLPSPLEVREGNKTDFKWH